MKALSQSTHSRRGSAPAVFVGLIALIVLAAVIGKFCFYTLPEWQQAVVSEFGEVKGDPVTQSGLHFKLPYQKVERYEKRLLRWDGSQTTAITRDRRTVNIDVTARWRIADARLFRETIRSTDQAERRLNGIIEGAVKDEIAKFDLYQVVRSSNRILEPDEGVQLTMDIDGDAADEISADTLRTLGSDLPRLAMSADGRYRAGRPIVLDNILVEAQRRVEQVGFGIHIEDILIKQLSYIREIEANVYAQMNAELQKIAAGFRSTGRQRAEQRLGEMELELSIIESDAIERSQGIRGQGEARSTAIYAEAFNEDPEFFLLLRRLEAFETLLGSNTRVVLGTDSPLFTLLKRIDPLTGHEPTATPTPEPVEP